MKIHSTFHVLVLLMAVLTFSLPFDTIAQQNSVQAEATAAAEADAKFDTDLDDWFAIGCGLAAIGGTVGAGVGRDVGGAVSEKTWVCGVLIGGAVGAFAPLIGIYNYQANPPPERLLGKSPEYVEFYADAYAKKTRSIRIQWAAAGAGAAVVSCGVTVMLLVGPFPFL